MQGGTGHNLVRQDAVPERANPTVPLRSLKIYKNTFSKLKHYKKRCRARPAIRGAKMRLSREGSNPTVPLRSLKIYTPTDLKKSTKIQNFVKTSKRLRTLLNASECIRMHPNRSEWVQTGPSMSKNFEKLAKPHKISRFV